MLDDSLITQLQSYLALLKHPIHLSATLNNEPISQSMLELLNTIAGLSDKVSIDTQGNDARAPSFIVTRQGQSHGVRFAGLPLGHEFTSLILTLLWTGGHPPKVDEDVIESIKALKGPHNFEVYMSLSCHNCPDVVQALSLMAIVNPQIQTTIIEGSAFQQEVEKRQIMAVPMIFQEGQLFGSGRMSVEEIVRQLDSSSTQKEAEKINQKPVFDVLVIGAGPAGSAAAIYAARKGIRTGIITQRMGGQVNDTLGIENYISLIETTGPELASAFERHIKHYDVDVINRQEVTQLKSAPQAGAPIEITLSNGALVQSRSVIIATGARWRQINVPGEKEYKNHGVAYCPHCDGPLFKGKRTAVIGGGNSGVEAAIDLAGIVEHVTVFEFSDQLKADAVLVNKLKSLRNVTVITQAQTTEITGDGQKVNGIQYQDRRTQALHHLPLEGVFIQIGLVPNTEWLANTLEMTPMGEIKVDAKCHTSLAGVFAAGDVTTVPYKQIIIAAGEGAKAALSAFDYLIRTPLSSQQSS